MSTSPVHRWQKEKLAIATRYNFDLVIKVKSIATQNKNYCKWTKPFKSPLKPKIFQIIGK